MSASVWLVIAIAAELGAAACGYAYAPPLHARHSPRWRTNPRWLQLAGVLLVIGLGLGFYGMAIEIGWAR